MERVKFGKTDMVVTKMALGCMPFGTPNLAIGFDPYTPDGIKRVEDTINYALDRGINFLDTADNYGADGYSETLVGRVLKTLRDDCYIATKCDPRSTYDEIIHACEGSLKRLQCDYIDLYQLHGSTKVFTREEQEQILHGGVVDALLELKRRGLIRYIGVTAEDYGCIESFVEADVFDAVQICYNIIRQGAGVKFLNTCREHDLGVCTMRPVTSGIFQLQLETLAPEWNENNRASMVSLAYSLSDSRVHMLNVGMRSVASVKRNMDFLDSFVVKRDIADIPITTAGVYKEKDGRAGFKSDDSRYEIFQK